MEKNSSLDIAIFLFFLYNNCKLQCVLSGRRERMIRVVVADDEYKVCQLICQLIDWEGMGMRLVGTASNGLEALQMIEAEKPDLVLTDIRMPEIGRAHV